MQKDELGRKIDDAIRQIEFFLAKLPERKNTIVVHILPHVSITDVHRTGGGMTYARVEVEVVRDPARYKIQGEDRYEVYDSIPFYWTWSAKYHLKSENLTQTVKAVSLMEFKMNLQANYAETHEEIVRDMARILDEAIGTLVRAKEEDKEVDLYRVPPHTLSMLDPNISGVRTISVAKLREDLFLNPGNLGKLLQQAREGGLTAEKPCRFRLLRQVLYE